ncbi:DUF2062 domain-containing protein [Thalassovita mediterranea]|uniref:DUF2062 domain-containing protein n=1 Tax=Thalassovita mediterranea TaxID=340021 RepID=A0A0N7M1C0_9RHOB|nr:DUF2062 domain-containing protein [Thalassovita mediterranea]MCG7573572.1 DUF2062 domain-containing protein [Phaeobacter sp. CNT1-3]CUH82883.1 hypothetical protein TM5383_00065 [Thalassovita mediterranea]SIS31463.1 hypothetical protein SAMN05421685_104207 [Thalassovita mediterranea]
MVFKRRDRRPIWRIVFEFFWPRGGWGRAARYVKHRLHRLPGSPEKIARGIFAGVFTTFSPFYGLHFVVAALLATLMRGNVLAALLATFFGNPLTYVPIVMTSMRTGYWLLGMDGDPEDGAATIGEQFFDAGNAIWHNLKAPFTGAPTDWTDLSVFYDQVFYPFMIGGIAPGIIAGAISYFISVPLIRAYQNRRKGVLKAKLDALKKKAHLKGDGSSKPD